MFDDLLRAVNEDIDNLANWHPLADWLIERGDPRGELINIDLALEGLAAGTAGGETEQLTARRTAILEQFAPELLGDTFARMIKDGYGQVAWRRGFVDEVRYVGNRTLAHRRAVGWLVRLMTTVHQPFTLLRKLDLSYTDIGDVAPLARFRNLVKLTLVGAQPTAASVEQLRTALPALVITP